MHAKPCWNKINRFYLNDARITQKDGKWKHYCFQNQYWYWFFLLLSQLLSASAPNILELQSEGDINKLIKALDYKFDAAIRADAVRALGEIGEPAVEKLLETYHDRDPEKLENIELALREISNNAIGGFAEEA